MWGCADADGGQLVIEVRFPEQGGLGMLVSNEMEFVLVRDGENGDAP